MNNIHKALIFVSVIIVSLIQNSHAQQNQPFSIEILSPKEGDSFEKIVPITWKSLGTSEELSYTVQLRLKEGHSWLTLEKNYQGNSLEHKIPSPYAIKDGQIRIIATDGIHEASTISGVFSANLNTGQDLTELDVRWDPFDKRWQAVSNETDDVAGFVLMFFGIVFSIPIFFGAVGYFVSKAILKRTLKEGKIKSRIRLVSFGIAVGVVVITIITFVMYALR